MTKSAGTISRNASDEPTSDERKDFVKRLFAVTISVGFATQLAQIIGHLDPGSGARHLFASITPSQWQELGLLVGSIFAVVLSWEGYLISIHRDPVETRARFYLDVIIVFVYLLLMLFSSRSDLWFFTLAVMFGVYLVWDALKIRERIRRAKREAKTLEKTTLVKNGLVTTALWFIVVIALYYFKFLGTPLGFSLALIAALCILVLYRIDKMSGGRGGWPRKLLLLAVPIALAVLSAKMR